MLDVHEVDALPVIRFTLLSHPESLTYVKGIKRTLVNLARDGCRFILLIIPVVRHAIGMTRAKLTIRIIVYLFFNILNSTVQLHKLVAS